MTRIFTVAVVVATCAIFAPLQAATMVPGVHGRVFQDNDRSGGYSSGEGMSGVAVQLYMDDGNGQLDELDTQIGPSAFTTSDGSYSFAELDANASYFVVRPEQTLGSSPFAMDASHLLTPGKPSLVIDAFDSSQSVRADPFTPTSATTLSEPGATVLGTERDMYARLVSGIGEVQVRTNGFGVAVIQYDNTSKVVGNGIITYDGEDLSAGPTPSLGLGDVDLTEGGKNTGVFVRLGIDSTGAGELIKFRIFDDSPAEFSEGFVEFPVTDGTATGSAYLDFADLSGPVSPNRVNAIQLWIGDDSPSIDAQIDIIGAIGPSTHDFMIVPEPTSTGIALVLYALMVVRRSRKP